MENAARKTPILSDSDDDVPLSKRVKCLPQTPPAKANGTLPLSSKKKNVSNTSLSAKSTTSSKNSSGSTTSKVSLSLSGTKSTASGAKSTSMKKTKPPVVSNDEDVPLAQMIKLMEDNKRSTQLSVASESSQGSKKQRKSTKSESTTSSTTLSTSKKEPPSEIDDDESEEYKWWENPTWDDTIKWETLEHCGVYFPPPYTPHGIKMHYNGTEIDLEPEAEEAASFFAALIGTDYVQNRVFCENFFADFQETLQRIDSKHKHLIQHYDKCDFTLMARHFETLKEARKSMTKEERERVKAEKKQLEDQFGWCLLDGRREKVGNFRIEPPGLFRGRGKHPKTGKLKARVRPEDITINIGRGARIPPPPPGRSWANVVHDNTVTWLATWTENINNATKYVHLAATSSLKGQSDYKKFETARELKKHIGTIRNRNAEELRSKEMMVRQRATALWLIDRLAIRAGNEKGDDEADTVGCCSLRLEHVSLNPTTSEVTFDFLGKDSIRYLNTVKVDPVIVKNLGIFMRPPKTATDPIFDRLTTASLNKYLTDLMPGLTAKVFRTYNASFTMQRELDTIHEASDASVAEKILGYNRANREVAVLCNHQRAVPKTHDQSMEKLQDKILTLKYQRLLIKREMRKCFHKREHHELGIDQDESDMDEETERRKKKELEDAEVDRQQKRLAKLAAEDQSVDTTAVAIKQSPTRNLSPETLQKRLASLTERIHAARHNAVDREENKATALGTSKINYIDPRITAAWCKIHDVPIEKMFNKSLRDKFKWAMDVSSTWRF